MKFVIVGAGSIGGYVGGQLAARGHEVGALARGATLQALHEHGWRIEHHDGRQTSSAVSRASTSAKELVEGGYPDVVIVALKAFSLPQVVGELAGLIGPSTLVLSAMNGVPWWFFEEFGGPARGMALPCVDPQGVIRAAIPHSAIVGCVVHMTCSSPQPGVSRHGFGDRLILGEPSGQFTSRVQALAHALKDAGFDAPIVGDIQREIWYKLWGNMTTNPISALTLATVDRIVGDPQVREYCLAIMREAAQVGAAIGCPISQSGEDRMAMTTKLGAFKTSMLQDREAGRPMEVDGLITAVHLIARHLQLPIPYTDSLLGLIRLLQDSTCARAS